MDGVYVAMKKMAGRIPTSEKINIIMRRDMPYSLAKFLAMVLEEYGSLKAFCEDHGANYHVLNRWMSGKRVPNLDSFEKHLHYLGYELTIRPVVVDRE